MIHKQDNHLITKAWLLILVATIMRLFYGGFFSIVPDEAYYWQWSRYLALGYHDHPPMIAWLIYLSTSLFGQHELAIRLPSILCLTIASGYTLLFAQRWISARAALLTIILMQSILAFNAGSIIATPDSPLMAAWAGACYHIARAYDQGKWYQWVLGGIWFGLGLLSKYTMAILPPLVFIFGLLKTPTRVQLKRVWPYAGFLLGCLLFLPVIIWNVENGWSTFRHAAHQGGVHQNTGLNFNFLLEFIGSQFGLLSPIVFVGLLIAWYLAFKKPFTHNHWILSYLFMTSCPVMIIFALLSLQTRVEANWSGPAYVTAVVLMGALVHGFPNTENRPMIHTIYKKIWPWAVGSSYLISALIMIHVYWPVIPVPVHLDRIAKETTGWEALAQETGEIRDSMPNPDKTFIFGLGYQVASELAFYMPGNPPTVSINRWRRPNAYEYWWQDADLQGWDAVGVCRARSHNTRRLKKIFETVSPPERFQVQRRDFLLWDRSDEPPVREYFLYRASGFKGGIEWIPPDPTDIRMDKTQIKNRNESARIEHRVRQ